MNNVDIFTFALSILSTIFAVFLHANNKGDFRYSFKCIGKLCALLWLMLITSVTRTITSTEPIWPIFLKCTLAAFAISTFIVYAIICFSPYYKAKQDNQWMISPTIVRFLYRIYFSFAAVLVPVAVYGEYPVSTAAALLICTIGSSGLNYFFFGFHGPRGTLLLTDSENPLSDVFCFRSAFSMNNPGGHRADIEAFVPIMLLSCATIMTCSVIFFPRHNLVLAFSNQALDWKKMVAILDSKTISYSYEELGSPYDTDSTRETASANEPMQEKNLKKPNNIEDNQDNSSSKKQSLLERLNSKPIRNPANQKPKLSNLLLFRALFLLIVAGIFMWILQRRSLKADYINRWERLNDRLHTILDSHAATQEGISNSSFSPVDPRAIHFAIDVIDLKMWGHRSFKPFFEEIVFSNVTDAKSNGIYETSALRKKLLERILLPG